MSNDYGRRLNERCDAWREKYPDRAEGLRRAAARLLGGEGFLARSGPTAAAWIIDMLRPTENEIIRVMQGWPEEPRVTPAPEPPPATTTTSAPVPTPPPLDAPPSGRDRALPTADQ